MAIISYSKNFIFSRTRKTASSTVQAILSRLCSGDDIVMGTDDDGTSIDESNSAGRNQDKFPNPHPHVTLDQIKSFVGEDYDKFIKIGTIRNPFEVVVSRYFWDVKGKGGKSTSIEGFRAWLPKYLQTTAWQDLQSNYVDNSFDLLIRHESFPVGLKALENLLNMEIEDVPYLKGGFRDNLHYSNYYTPPLREMVEQYFAKDFKLFGYRFEVEFDFHVESLGPVVTQSNCGWDNINGPCVINSSRGRIIYFANHQGTTIKAAFLDLKTRDISEPWDCLKLENTPCHGHIASPDVYRANGKWRMLYHGGYQDEQLTFEATSVDGGVTFQVEDRLPVCKFYARRFSFQGKTHIIAKNGNKDAILYTSVQGYEPYTSKWEVSGNLIDNCRHTAAYVKNDYLYIFYSLIGGKPEAIRCLKVDKDWWPISDVEVHRPLVKWEGAQAPLEPSRPGMAHGWVNQLRDPYIYEEDGEAFMFYSFAGEKGIAVAKLHI